MEDEISKGIRTVKNGESGFNVEDYIRRLRLLRVAHSGENQVDFAKRLGVPFKRWSNYERGYPLPRETAWLLLKEVEGLTVEWLWFGWENYLSKEFKAKLKKAEQADEVIAAAEREVAQAQKKLKQARESVAKSKASHADKRKTSIPAQ